jgi:PBP1b-binding outer membrane lipoprotein LpoB
MRVFSVLTVAAVVLVGCTSNTDSAEPTVTATTVYQQDVNSFCQDVKDAIENRDSADPEDQAERLADLQEAAQQLGIGTRDDMYAADALTKCADELQDAINGQ